MSCGLVVHACIMHGDNINPFHSHYPHHDMSSTSESSYRNRMGLSSHGGSTYGLSNHSSSQMPHASYHEIPYWVIPQYPIYGLHVGRDHKTYNLHVSQYRNRYQNSCTWEHYCMMLDGSIPTTNLIEPHRHSSYY